MKEHIAIVGTGVAGLGCAWNLRHHARLTLLEQDTRPGGHTNTVNVMEGGRSLPIDTGFIVFNKVTYPNLCRLFDELAIPIKPSEMSFSVQHLREGLEYNGMGLNKIFAQRRNLLSPRFLLLLQKIQRFFKAANTLLDSTEVEHMTMRDFAHANNLGRDFLDLYLVPMSSAVWSTDPHVVLDFPARALIRFFHNHGFLGVDTHHPWFTVDGGAKTYVDKILATLGAPRLQAAVTRVTETPTSAEVTTATGETLSFDRVILACHADQALAALAAPTPDQRKLLAPFHYQKNHATLHTDESVMPQRRLAWASWNYRVRDGRATTHYWMNALQGLSPDKNFFVSLNSENHIPRDKILYETLYEHPVFSVETLRAQPQLPSLNTPNRRINFCGSYFKYGFHEDAYTSGLQLAQTLQPHLAA